MQVLQQNVLVRKIKPEYSGLIQGVVSEENTQGKIMNIGSGVTLVNLGELAILDWKKAKPVGGDLWVVSEDDIVAVID